MKLLEIKEKVEKLIERFGSDTEVSFQMFTDDCGCFDMDADFDNAEKDDDKVLIDIKYQ